MTSGGSAHVLLVDSDPQIHRLLAPVLEAGGYQVTTARNGREALADIYQLGPDLVLLELTASDDEGWRVLRETRGLYDGAIIVLSGTLAADDHVAALEQGADDCLEKPFSVGELMARIRSVLRLSVSPAKGAHLYRDGDLEIDFERRIVARGGESVRLTPQEADVFGLLVRSAGRIVTHRQLLKGMTPSARGGDVRHLRVIIGQIRGKLEGSVRGGRRIRTVPGVGYVFEE